VEDYGDLKGLKSMKRYGVALVGVYTCVKNQSVRLREWGNKTAKEGNVDRISLSRGHQGVVVLTTRN
jgi:hypothetical protein